MTNELNELKNLWQDAKKGQLSASIDANEIISLSKKKMKNVVSMHVKNIATLAITLVGLIAFFKYVAPLQETLSHVGIFLMTGGLIVRILIELYSIYFSSQINMSTSVSQNSNASLNFFQFRKRIHGPVMYTILVAYTIGFYILTPEFSFYFSTTMMILMDASYLVGAVIVGYFINLGIKKEMSDLRELLQIQNELHGE